MFRSWLFGMDSLGWAGNMFTHESVGLGYKKVWGFPAAWVKFLTIFYVMCQ